jgi:putative transposase
MKGKAFSEEQIVALLQRVEAGQKVMDACREHGISEQTYYRWKAKYGGMPANELKRLRDLEQENARLKRLLADAMLDNAALKEVLAKKW